MRSRRRWTAILLVFSLGLTAAALWGVWEVAGGGAQSSRFLPENDTGPEVREEIRSNEKRRLEEILRSGGGSDAGRAG